MVVTETIPQEVWFVKQILRYFYPLLSYLVSVKNFRALATWEVSTLLTPGSFLAAELIAEDISWAVRPAAGAEPRAFPTPLEKILGLRTPSFIILTSMPLLNPKRSKSFDAVNPTPILI